MSNSTKTLCVHFLSAPGLSGMIDAHRVFRAVAGKIPLYAQCVAPQNILSAVSNQPDAKSALSLFRETMKEIGVVASGEIDGAPAERADYSDNVEKHVTFVLVGRR